MACNRLWLFGASLARQSAPHQSPATLDTCFHLRPPPRAGFWTLAARREPAATAASQRYGSANEPPPHLVSAKLKDKAAPVEKALPKPQGTKRKVSAAMAQELQVKERAERGTAEDAVVGGDAPLEDVHVVEGRGTTATAKEQSKAAGPANGSPDPGQAPTAPSQVLTMEPPMAEDNPEKPPHLQATPYVHHFDTFTLVRALQAKESFTEDQAVTIMKAVRALLADNMDLARAGIVSKSDGEMEAYLFRAACTELRTEMRNNRATLTERMRAERTMLQHEVDILAQRIAADAGSLKDELKGMFDDRRMTVRTERRDVENKVQELNYHITSRLNSEMRSEVEGLRWVLVRRTAIAIVVVAATALVVLRLNSRAEKRAEIGASARRRVERAREAELGGAGEAAGVAGGGEVEGGARRAGGEVKGTELLVESGGDPSLVSLG